VSWPGGPWKGEVDKGTVEKCLTLAALSLSLVSAHDAHSHCTSTREVHLTFIPICTSLHPPMVAALIIR